MSASHTPGPVASLEGVSAGVIKELKNALELLDRVTAFTDDTSDSIGCAELAIQRVIDIVKVGSKLEEINRELLEALKNLHTAYVCGADETGYVTDVGFMDIDAIVEKARAAIAKAEVGAAPHVFNRPKVVCLCGSTRYLDAFQEANLRETIAGNIVLSIGCNIKSDSDLIALGELTEEAKAKLDDLHKRKIDLADEVLVLNVGGYIGTSTRSEIDYAIKLGKPVRWSEPAKAEGAQ